MADGRRRTIAAVKGCLRRLALVLAVVTATGGAARGEQPVGLELVLLVDVSSSVSDEEYRLQIQGLAAAFRDPAVHDALRASLPLSVAVSVIQWANHANQRRSLPWRELRGASGSHAFADRISTLPRMAEAGHTALGDALAFAMEELRTNGYDGLRRVIDVSGDGRSNDGRPMYSTRNEVLAEGVTINGLAIVNELPLLGQYYRDWVIGGEGAFVIVAQDFVDFADAMRKKLVREIRAMPLALKRPKAMPQQALERSGARRQ